MIRKRTYGPHDLSSWGLHANDRGELLIGGCNTLELAGTYGTPLHVVDENRLKGTAKDLLESLQQVYPEPVKAHFALKSNSVPGVVSMVREAGLRAEVMSELELRLALHLGFTGNEIILNGPYKPERLLKACLEEGIRFIIIDSLYELSILERICQQTGQHAHILLRINPDFIPRGMNQGSATGSRKGCVFGLDLKAGEVERALKHLSELKRVHFKGFHFHIGTGIHCAQDYFKALGCLKDTVSRCRRNGFQIEVFDTGGGFSASTSRGMSTKEMLLYEAFDRLPGSGRSDVSPGFRHYADAISRGMRSLFDEEDLPELIVEPGRSISGPNQLLLLQVHSVKERPGIKKWLITDGGIGTVTMPTYYEYHEVLLCNDVNRPRGGKVTITGPVCFAGDIVYRNKPMPPVSPGEILAILDSGAYFTAWESSFGFARPAIAAALSGHHRLLRRRESFADMIARDMPVNESIHH